MNGETWTQYEFQPAPRDLLCKFRYPLPGIAGDAYREYVGYSKDFAPYYDPVAAWHLFVLAGSVAHYFVILFYVVPRHG